MGITLRKAHYASGLTITVFVMMHLFNHTLSILGADVHIEAMDTLRQIYRNPFIETVLLLAVAIQIVSGIKLFKAGRRTATTWFDKLQIWSGLYLAIFFIIHLSAVFGGRLFLHLDTNFYFGVAGLNTFPFYLFFIPYYGLAILAFFGHIAAIHSKKMKQHAFGLSPQQQATVIMVFGLVLTLATFYGLTNHLQGVAIPKEYEVLIGQ
jgi:hypothetical protein